MDENNYKFDPNTGEPIVRETVNEQPAEAAPAQEAPQYEAPQYEAPQYQAPQYEAPQYEAPQYQAPVQQPQAQGSKAKGIVGMVLSISGLCLSWLGVYFGFFGIIPLGACIAGLILSKEPTPFAKAGKICGIIGTVLSGIFMLVGFIMLLALGMYASY